MIHPSMRIAFAALTALSAVSCDQTDQMNLRSEGNQEDLNLPDGMSDSST
jgi:hypothetical protein